MSNFAVPYQQPVKYTISGITKDSNAVVVPGATVSVFETVSGMRRAVVVSGADGSYSADVTGGQGLTFFCVAYLAGSPDIEGTTVNTLVGV